MQQKILTTENFKTSNWSGGTTTEFFIYPPKSSYLQRNFSFRLSSAKVEIEKSDFTPLPGISRKLMVLQGEILLVHENHYSKLLHKSEQDEFEGGWKTSSIGKCTDFNLMTRGKTTGNLNAILIQKNQTFNYPISEPCDWLFVYALLGTTQVVLSHRTYELNQGELMVRENLLTGDIQFIGIEQCELIIIKVVE